MGDEQAAGAGPDPKRPGIRRRALDPGYGASPPGRAVKSGSLVSQSGVAGWADPHEVATGKQVRNGSQLRTVGLEESLRPAPVLRSPHTHRAFKDTAGVGWVRIADNRGIKVGPLGTEQYRRRSENPFRGITIVEVHIVGLARESVDAQRVIRGTEAGLT